MHDGSCTGALPLHRARWRDKTISSKIKLVRNVFTNSEKIRLRPFSIMRMLVLVAIGSFLTIAFFFEQHRTIKLRGVLNIEDTGQCIRHDREHNLGD